MNVREPSDCRALRLAFVSAAAAAIVCSCAGICWAQRPAAAPPGGMTRNDVMTIMRDRSYGANEAKFDAYFAAWFAQFDNAAKPDSKIKLDVLRNELRIYLRAGKSGPPHDKLNQLALTKMLGLLKGPIAVRYNALLIIGDLNKDDSGGRTVVPLEKAFHYLKIAITDARVPDDLKIAGMIGVERFAQNNAIPPKDKPEIAKALLALLRQSDPPSTRTLDGHVWMRRSAAQILATMGAAAADPAVVEAMTAIIANPQEPESLRCEVAEHIGQMKYPPEAKVDYASLANLLGHQLVDICKPKVAGTTPGGSPDQNNSGQKRILAYATISTLHGLEGANGVGGLVAATKGGDKAVYDFVNELRTKVTTISESIEKSEQINPVEIQDQIADLESSLRPKPAPKAAPPAEEKKAQTADIAKQPRPADAPTARAATGAN